MRSAKTVSKSNNKLSGARKRANTRMVSEVFFLLSCVQHGCEIKYSLLCPLEDGSHWTHLKYLLHFKRLTDGVCPLHAAAHALM